MSIFSKKLFKEFIKNEDGFLGKIVSAITSPVASLAGSALGFVGNQRANSTSQRNAANANAFTREQLQNQHQWEVEDLKKAGLNPVLSAKFGGNAPGTSAQATTINPNDKIGELIQSAVAVANLKKLDAEVENIKADTKTKGSIERMNQQIGARAQADAKNLKTQNQIIKNEVAKSDVTRSIYKALEAPAKAVSNTGNWLSNQYPFKGWDLDNYKKGN